MEELQITVPHAAWGDGEEWVEAHEDLLGDLDAALADTGAGDQDDADHQDDHVVFFVAGEDIEAVLDVVRPVLDAHGVLDEATGFVADLGGDDAEAGRPVRLSA